MSQTNTIYRLVGDYANALGRYGPDSPETDVIRDANANNAEFLAYADALDRIKRHLGGKGMEREECTKKSKIEQLKEEVDRLQTTLNKASRRVEERLSQHRENLRLWENGYLIPTEPDGMERRVVMEQLKAAIAELEHIFDSL